METNSRPLISVTVPIYNVDKYMIKCVDSILNQTYRNIEIILVDDGSPDKCSNICDEYTEMYKNIIVVHKRNGGLSDARNIGLDILNGSYVMFVDSDDYIDTDSIERLLQNIKEKNTDISSMNFYLVDNNNHIISKNRRIESKTKYKGYEFLIAINTLTESCSACGKLMKVSSLKGLRFNKERLNEDYLFLSELLLNYQNTSISFIDYCGYFYVKRDNSISRAGLGKSSMDAVYNTREMKELAKQKCNEVVPYIGAYAAYQARTVLLLMSENTFNRNKEFGMYLISIIRENIKLLLNLKYRIKDKIFCLFVSIEPRITLKIIWKLRKNNT